MATTGFDRPSAAHVRPMNVDEKYGGTPIDQGIDSEALPYSPSGDDSLKSRIDSTHRKLKSRHIQLIGIGGYATSCVGDTMCFETEPYCVL